MIVATPTSTTAPTTPPLTPSTTPRVSPPTTTARSGRPAQQTTTRAAKPTPAAKPRTAPLPRRVRISAGFPIKSPARGHVLSVVLQDLPREHDEVSDPPVSHPVAHSAVLAAGHDEAAPAPTRQVIRDPRRREAEVRHQRTHRVLAAPRAVQGCEGEWGLRVRGSAWRAVRARSWRPGADRAGLTGLRRRSYPAINKSELSDISPAPGSRSGTPRGREAHRRHLYAPGCSTPAPKGASRSHPTGEKP